MTDSAKAKPPRTFGLSIAIIGSVMVFTLMPLIQLAWLALLRFRLHSLDYGQGAQPVFVGGFYTDVTGAELIMRVGFGILFLIVAVFAWYGRPPAIRFVMLAAVLVMTVMTVIVIIVPLIQSRTLASGLDSGDTFRRIIAGGELMVSLLIPLYVIWYINRGPARAFYRGYYLDNPRSTSSQETRTRP